MNKVLSVSFGVGVSVLLAFTPVKAQEQLSLSDAIQIGLERNYDIRIEDKTVEIAGNNNSWGEAGRYPSLNLNLNQNNSITDNVETASPFALLGEIKNSSLSPGVQLNWTIFNGLQANISKNRLEELQRQSEGNASVVVANTIESIILGYYNVLLQRERLNELQNQLNLSRDEYNYIVTKAELGGAVTADLLLEENNYLSDSALVINQELVYRNALRQLNFLIAEPEPEKEYEFTDPLQVELIEYDFEDLAARLDRDNVDLRKQYISQKVLTYDLQLARATRLPKLDFIAGYTNNQSRVNLRNTSLPQTQSDGTRVLIPGSDIFPDPLNSITNTTFGNFALTFNLFNGGRVNRAIQNAVISEDIGNVRLEKLRSELYRDLKQEYDRYNTRRLVYGINARKREGTAQNLDLSAEKFRNGSINSFDYRTVQINDLAAAFQELQAVYNLIEAKVGLMRLTGGLISEYKD